MSYNILTTDNFSKETKRLSKKYKSLKNELKDLFLYLMENPFTGDLVYKNCYKIRLAIKSKGKGKSGGARIITHVLVEKNEIYLLSIYDKSEIDSVSDDRIIDILKTIQEKE